MERADVELTAGKVRVLADAIARAVDADDEAVRFGQRFPEGLRVTVLRPPAAPAGPVITLSRPPAGPPTLDDLVSWGGLSGDAAARIGEAFDDGHGVLVAGNSQSARRALLVALASSIRDSERVVLVDEGSVHPPELEHLVRLRVSDAPGASRSELIAAAADLDADRLLLDGVGPQDLLTILLDAGDAYRGVIFAAPGPTVEAAVDRLLCIARGAASTGDPAPLIPACLGLVVVASSGGGAEPRVSEIGEITADLATGAPDLSLLFRRSGPGGELVHCELRPTRSAKARPVPVESGEDLPGGFRTTVAHLDKDEAEGRSAEDAEAEAQADAAAEAEAQAEFEAEQLARNGDGHDTATNLPPPPLFESSAAFDPRNLADPPVSADSAAPFEMPDSFQPAPPMEGATSVRPAPSPPPAAPDPAPPTAAPFEERTNIIRMVPQELLDLEE